jgi:ATP/maltotriose-dependent transcriptional regulator MalT
MPAVPNAKVPQMPIMDNSGQFLGQLQEAYVNLERSQQEIMQRLSHLETLNQQLLETSNAIFNLTKKIETVRQEAKEQIISQVRLLLLPLLECMREYQGMTPSEPQLSKLIQCIEQVDSATSASTSYTETLGVLTSQEQRIVAMIRHGMTNDNIAAQLHVAPTTVKTHRRNIRKKLGIRGAKNRLHTYLQTPESLHSPSSPLRLPHGEQRGESHHPTVIPLHPDQFHSHSSKGFHPITQDDL